MAFFNLSLSLETSNANQSFSIKSTKGRIIWSSITLAKPLGNTSNAPIKYLFVRRTKRLWIVAQCLQSNVPKCLGVFLCQSTYFHMFPPLHLALMTKTTNFFLYHPISSDSRRQERLHHGSISRSSSSSFNDSISTSGIGSYFDSSK